MVPPYAIHDGIVRFAFIGDNKQVDRFLATIESTGIPYRLISMTDAKFAFDSSLNVLTEEQRKALIVAFNSGVTLTYLVRIVRNNWRKNCTFITLRQTSTCGKPNAVYSHTC
jgi:hypothetical protein